MENAEKAMPLTREQMIEALAARYEQYAESHHNGFTASDVVGSLMPLIERWLAEAELRGQWMM